VKEWQEVFKIKDEQEFESWALRIYEFQYQNCEVYRDFCDLLNIKKPKALEEIPFLPISFFKTHAVKSKNLPVELLFKSSGTSGLVRSQHFVQCQVIYRESFFKTYVDQMGDPVNQVILALLPSYLEQGESSLVYMVEHLIQATKNPLSGYLLNDLQAVQERYNKALDSGKEVVIFGVSYALLDLAEQKIDLSQATIVETGGMKGRRKELSKEELHQALKDGLGCDFISSEYGMTELFSQAYSKKDGLFSMPPWMKIILRETNDPLSFLNKPKTGGINVIDLANIFSCSFISTQDLGRLEEGKLRLMGRFDHADVRGCNLLVDE
jgi:phenylacetate-coenzyme A ligase PaaK-like adenylate-forming protein